MDITGFINNYTAKNVAEELRKIQADKLKRAEEIRLRCSQPITVRCGSELFYPREGGYMPTREDLEVTLSKMSRYSVYAFNEEIKQGYITLSGGFRVGICGSVVYENGTAVTIKNISSLNIRLCRQIKGCADKVINSILGAGGFLSTLVISPPACGKTTLLRDIVRQLSDRGICVGLVDERSEIAGICLGQAQNDVGRNTDILDGCRKLDGMYMLLRSMAPRVIAVDEIGSEAELNVIRQTVNSGVGLLCTIHAADIEELKQKPFFKKLLADRLFKRYVLLSGVPHTGTVVGIYNEELKICDT